MITDGILLVDKPKNWTSFDVVAKIRGTLQAEKRRLHTTRGFCVDPPKSGQTADEFRCRCKVKVGHTGTLDPLATGLMIVVVGSYCKRANEFSKLDKIYEVEMKFGVSSTTGDEEGEKTYHACPEFGLKQVEKTLESFIGESLQTPPIYSAIKINGQKAYNLARKGQKVELQPRKITIYDIKLKDYSFPLLSFRVHVSSGTYIRSLVKDIAKKLGTSGYLTDLRRTKVGNQKINDSISMHDLDKNFDLSRLLLL